MTGCPALAANTPDGPFARFAKWLIRFDYDQIDKTDIVEFEFKGIWHDGWGLLFTLVALAAIIWLVFWLYRREGRTASLGKKIFLAVVRTVALLLALFMFLEPTLVVSKLRETLSPVIVLLDTSESITIDDLYSDRADAEAVANASGRKLDRVLNRRVPRKQIVTDTLNNPDLDLLNRLARKNPVQVYTFGARTEELLRLPLLRPEDLPEAEEEAEPGDGADTDKESNPKPKRFDPGTLELDAKSGRTYLGRAVGNVLETAGGRPIAGIVVLTDGQDNDPDLDATTRAGASAAREDVPVFGVPVGLSKSRKTKNIRMDKRLQANRTMFVGDPAEFTALVSSSGYQNQRVGVRLFRQKVGRREEKVVASDEVVIGANASDQPVSLTYEPLEGDEGEYLFTMRIGPLADEHLQRDNLAVASGVRIVQTSTNVLLVGGSPTWEYRRLRNLFIQDKSVTLSCWLQSATTAYPQVGNRLLTKLPRTRAELFHPDDGPHVMILIDVDHSDFDRDWFKLLEEFVDEKAGGLLYVAGEKYSYDLFKKTSISAPLIRMLPVELHMDRAQLVVGGGPKGYRLHPLRPTEDGLQSPLLRFSTERSTTERIWQSIPGAVWSFPVRRPKPAGTVLIRTLDPRRRISVEGKQVPMPVYVTGFYGRGRVAWMGFDESWRWRKLGSQVYDTFWTQAVRSLVEGRLMGGKRSVILETDSESYPLGSPVTVSAKVFDAAGKPERLPAVNVKIERTGAPTEAGDEEDKAAPVRGQVALKPVPGAPGTYKAQYVPPRTGFYKLSIIGSESVGAAANTSIEVASQFEFDHPETNRVRLAELIDPSVGGGLVELGAVGTLPDRIESRKEQVIERGSEIALWANPLMLFLMVILLGTEWAIRKRANMA
jgi:hypothetical protein